MLVWPGPNYEISLAMLLCIVIYEKGEVLWFDQDKKERIV